MGNKQLGQDRHGAADWKQFDVNHQYQQSSEVPKLETSGNNIQSDRREVQKLRLLYDVYKINSKLFGQQLVFNITVHTATPIVVDILQRVSIGPQMNILSSASSCQYPVDRDTDVSHSVSLADIAEADQIVPLCIHLKAPSSAASEELFYYLGLTDKGSHRVLGKYLKLKEQMVQIKDVYGIEKSVLSSPEETDQTLCILCMESVVDTIIQPCNHMLMCQRCAELLKKQSTVCPMCKQPLAGLVIVSQKE